MASRLETLVSEEIKRIVAEAAEKGTSLSMQTCIDRLQGAFPNCGLSERDIKSEIFIAAATAMVAVVAGRKLENSP